MSRVSRHLSQTRHLELEEEKAELDTLRKRFETWNDDDDWWGSPAYTEVIRRITDLEDRLQAHDS